MNSKQRRREEKRLHSSSQYGILPPSSIAVSFETVKKMGKDYQSFVDKERKNQDAGANLPEVQSGNSFNNSVYFFISYQISLCVYRYTLILFSFL